MERNSKGHFVKGHKCVAGSEKGWFKNGSKKLPNAYKWGPKEANPRWNGGRYITPSGYVLVYSPGHPSVISKKYVFEHRLVMEKHLGRYLDPKEVVHHINANKQDNRIENLMLFKSHSAHKKHEAMLKEKK